MARSSRFRSRRRTPTTNAALAAAAAMPLTVEPPDDSGTAAWDDALVPLGDWGEQNMERIVAARKR